MECFFIGLHDPCYAWPFQSCFISVNRLSRRESGFMVNDWIMDSGAFTEISTYGRWRSSPQDYLREIERWKTTGNLLAVVTQDMMCEPFVLQKSGLSIAQHQEITTARYEELMMLSPVYILPVLQGFMPEDYAAHLDLYGALLGPGQWVGVGSVCRRNSRPEEIYEILSAIKAKRPDLRLHGFGLKLSSLKHSGVCNLLYSSDSLAWSQHARRNYKTKNRNDPREALLYAQAVADIIGRPVFYAKNGAQRKALPVDAGNPRA